MKTFLKWFLIVVGALLLIVAGIVAYIGISHSRFGLYPSGGFLAETQARYDVVYYDIQVTVDARTRTIDGRTIVRFRATEDELDSIELDLIDNFDVASVSMPGGAACSFTHGDDKLIAALPQPLDEGDVADLEIRYRGTPPEAILPPWIGGFNWSKDPDGLDWIGLSCQGEGAKIWMPCKDHPDDEPDSVAVNITVPARYVAASNGVLRGVTRRDSLATYHWATTYPINNYSITINIGNYSVVERPYVTASGDTMPVQYYVLPSGRAGADSLLIMAVDMLSVYRKYFGEYPWAREKFALVHTAYLGMEHQTINSYGNNYAYTHSGGFAFDELMLHEMGHEWWGNLVTVKDWADFWIHEGICTYGEALYLLERRGEAAYHDHMRKKRNLVSNRKPIVQGEHLSGGKAYHGDIYTKGACVMHALRYVLGDSVFFPMLKTFASDPSTTLQNRVTTRDFIGWVNKTSGQDHTHLLDLYLRTTDLPELRIDSTGPASFAISIPNIDFTIPMDVRTDAGLHRMELGRNPVAVASTVRPVIDERNWFLKRDWKPSDR